MIFFVVISGVFVFAQIILEQIFSEAISKVRLVADTPEDNEFRTAVNTRIEGIPRIQKDYIPWSYFVEYIADNSNANITFNNLEISEQDQQIKLIGVAENRSSLLEFKNDLQGSPHISEVIFPIENILKKEDVDFNIRIKYNLEGFKDNGYEF